MRHMFKNREGKVRSGWKLFFVTVAFFALAQLVRLVFGQWLWLVLTIQSALLAVVVLVAWRVVAKRRMSEMGLGCVKGKELLAGLLLGLVSAVLVFAVIVLTGSAYIESWIPRFTADTVLFLLAFVCVGVAEEMLTRGYVMSVLRQTKSVPVILLVSSVLFSLMHAFNDGFGLLPFVNIVLTGLLLAYMFFKSGSIWMPIGYHIMWNYAQGNVFGFHVSGFEVQGLINTQYAQENVINGGPFGFEGGVAATAVILLSFLFVRWYYRKSRFEFLSMDGQSAVTDRL